MKKIIIGLFLLLSACGSGGGSATSGASHVPSIASLSYSPHSAALNSGGGAVAISASFNFIDTGADIVSAGISIQDANTLEVLSTTTSPISGVSGISNGTINVFVNAATTSARNYIFAISVNDAAGNHSNPLNGTFSIQ